MQLDTTPQMLKADDVARCLGLTRSTVYDWIARGHLPSHRFGRTIRISSDDLEAYLARTRMNDFATVRELEAQEELGIGMPETVPIFPSNIPTVPRSTKR